MPGYSILKEMLKTRCQVCGGFTLSLVAFSPFLHLESGLFTCDGGLLEIKRKMKARENYLTAWAAHRNNFTTQFIYSNLIVRPSRNHDHAVTSCHR